MSGVTTNLLCPHCGRIGSTTSTVNVGVKVRCPSCQQTYRYWPTIQLGASTAPAASVANQNARSSTSPTPTGNPLASTALGLGIIAILLCWIPLFGLLSVLTGSLGLVLGIAGTATAPTGGRHGLAKARVGAGLGLVAMIAAVAISWKVVTIAAEAGENAMRAQQLQAAPPAFLPNPLPVAAAPFQPPPFQPPAINPQPIMPAPPARNRAPRQVAADPEPVPMGDPFVLGDLEVRVVKAERGKVSIYAMASNGRSKKQSLSTGELLSIFVEVKNAGRQRKIDYLTLAGPTVRLTDDIGNRYKVVSFGASAFPVGRTASASIYPGKTIGDQLVFEPPVGEAVDLTLEIPAEKAGAGKVSFRFKIPVATIVDRAGN